MTERSPRLYWSIGIIIAVALIPFLMRDSVKTFISNPPPFASGTWDISEQVKSAGYDQYLREEEDFDYTTPNLMAVAGEIKHSSSSPRDAIEKVIKYTHSQITYTSIVSQSFCYGETASSVLKKRVGDCVSMSRLNTALLRSMGIPARTIGGCLSKEKRCTPLFAVVPGAEIKTTALLEGDDKKRGFLHEWLEAWIPGEGWVLIESTSGQAFKKECMGDDEMYKIYDYDSNNINRCVISDASFNSACRVY